MDVHDKQIIHSSDESNWRTPPELFEALDREVKFCIDLAANAQNYCTRNNQSDDRHRWLGPGSGVSTPDALSVDWTALVQSFNDLDDPRQLPPGFLNPPYSRKKYRATKDPAMLVENWARKAYEESIRGFTTYGLFPFAPQTGWFREFVYGHRYEQNIMGERLAANEWSGHAAMEVRRFPYRLSFLRPDGSPAQNAGVNSCVIIWKPNPGYVGPWVPTERYWSFK